LTGSTLLTLIHSDTSSPLTVLHITQWYPTEKEPYAALWVKRHIDALRPHGKQIVWHVQTTNGSIANSYKVNTHGIVWRISIPFSRWFLIELITLFQLLWLGMFQHKILRSCDLVNFHIAYPSLTYWPLLKYWYPKKVVITEHWSAYHFNFGVKKKLPRIQRIFSNGIPIITVSQSLQNDIAKFSGHTIWGVVIPNVVDTNVFNFQNKLLPAYPVFFMVSLWKYPKDPLAVIAIFSNFLREYPHAQLRIAGYGPLMEDMKEYIETHKLATHVHLLGSMTPSEIAGELNTSTALIHLSEYETFSVVCAEAVCCGCPVIASKVGGIPEFIDEFCGVLVQSKDEMLDAMNKLVKYPFNRMEIGSRARAKFESELIGQNYFKTLLQITYEP